MASNEEGRKEVVCVTGAGGYVASWLVNLLLSKDYIVHGTVRNPGDEKNAHLKKLEKAAENLKLFPADLLNYDSLRKAISGCTGVFHVACPVPSSTVPNPEVDLIEPAVTGTLNVLKACSDERVKRVVVVSSMAAVAMIPKLPKDQVMDETYWSDKEYCRATKNWYCLAKTAAEMEAFEYAKKYELDMVTVCPCLVIGPMLQSTTNASSLVLIKMLKEGLDTMENKVRKIVDVRDVADALLLTYEKPEAKGRYLCVTYMIRARDLVEKLRSMYPNYNYPKSFTEVEDDEKYSTEKLQKLGWNYRPLEESLADSVKSYQELGILSKN
ncbi:Cinnamoyl-coa reductase [Thalictrum thalictroides]|uniref:Cinnamoyl-coa reductase n=1 Tax=Thalictrum thalictroides TaxID=46969 RepID=A0A7J6WJ74_THATH|nr:Cinnamoyl-coa reductase [Thalictrum thalictroides]